MKSCEIQWDPVGTRVDSRAKRGRAGDCGAEGAAGGGSKWGYLAKARKLRWAGCELDQA